MSELHDDKSNHSCNTELATPNKFILLAVPFFIVAGAIGILILMKMLSPVPEKKAIVSQPPLVATQDLLTTSVTLKIASQGTVMPLMETDITAEVSGRIIEISPTFDNGGYFHRGEVILKIDDADYQVALSQAKARLSTAKANLLEQQARAKQAEDEWLLTGKPLSEAPVLALRKPQLQKAMADIALAKAEITAANIKLSRTIIKAPYDAVIKNKQADLGQFVNAGSTIGAMFSIEAAEIRLPIKHQDIPFLKLPELKQNVNEQADVLLTIENAGVTTSWQAKLVRYEGEVDQTSRVHYVIAQLSDPYNVKGIHAKPELRVGSFVKASITGKTFDNLVAIPRNAVIGKNTLYLIDDENKLVIKPFSVLRADNNHLYSQDDFSKINKMVLTELALPVNGMTLRVADADNKDSAQEVR